jgi:hypothetical protein
LKRWPKATWLICGRVRKEVIDYLGGADYAWEDLDRIVLLLDTDGSFIPDDLVVENDQVEHICYYTDHVELPNANRARRRNKERSHYVRKISARQKWAA